jgi:hypothetical protein
MEYFTGTAILSPLVFVSNGEKEKGKAREIVTSLTLQVYSGRITW